MLGLIFIPKMSAFILAFNLFSLGKLIFCLMAGAVSGWLAFRKTGPWGYFTSILRFFYFGGITILVLGLLLFPVLGRIQFQMTVPPLMLHSNSDLHYHSIKHFYDPPIYGYLEHLPPGYNDHPDKKYPMLIFLHGLVEYGNGKDKIYRAAELGAPREVEKLGKLCVDVNGKEECFIVLSPQKSDKVEWTADVQRDFWHYILHGPEHYRYDPERIYLTGLSQGSHGVWEWADSDEPDADMLAGIVPVSGRGTNPTNACRLEQRGINVWAIHGAEDPILPPKIAREEFDALERCEDVTSAEHIWTSVPDVGHWMYESVYINDHNLFNPNIYEWMARTKKKYPPERPRP